MNLKEKEIEVTLKMNQSVGVVIELDGKKGYKCNNCGEIV